jgi:3-phenylpropionate/trans-cinnamate dioxygenase ferredoxin reductase subunit
MRVVVAGASVAGVAACAALRGAGYDGGVVLLGDESHVPYDRPPLSKQLLCGTLNVDDIVLPAAPRLGELDVDWRAGIGARGLDLASRTLSLDDGARLGFDGLIIATGSRARRLPDQPVAEGLFVLRTLDDALALRAAVSRAAHVVVVGAGFIGLEVASSARSLGVRATVLETAGAPMTRALGPELGGWFSELHADHDVDIRCGVTVRRVRVEDGRVTGVEISHAGGDARLLDADVVVVGVGAAPCTAWLRDSGLGIDDGVVCDATLKAASGVYAAGDVARWHHPGYGSIRVEHWTTAGYHGRTAASNLAAELDGRRGERLEADEIPYFWSDQHETKIQMAGWVPGYDQVEVLPAPKGRAVLFGRRGRLVGVMAWNQPALVARQRRAMASPTSFEAAVAAAGDGR